MADANNNPVKCPFCGSVNPVGSAFCQDCGKEFSGESPAQSTAKNESFQSPPLPTANYQSPFTGHSHRSRNVIIAVVAAILIVSLVFASVQYFSPNNIDNNSLNSPTPSATAEPTRTPTKAPTTMPTVKPTPTPTAQPPNNTISAINLQFVYQGSDQGYFGPNSQTFNFSNQPNGMLSINQGTEFWYSFKLNMATPASPDSISSIAVSTPGFSLISVEPPTPIAFTQGSSITITVHVQSPQSSFQGAVTLVLTTSG